MNTTFPRLRSSAIRWVSPACLAFLLLAGGTNCGGKKDTGASGIPAREFRVDPALLGPAVTDSVLRVTFRPPAIFQPGNPEAVSRIQDQVRRETKAEDSFATMPVLLFGRPEGGSRPALCILSRFVQAPAQGMSGEWIESCRRHTRETVAPATPQDELYRVGKTVVLQFLVQNKEMVLFRLVCQGPGAPIQVDYLLPRGEYAETVRAIESSVGSMVLF